MALLLEDMAIMAKKNWLASAIVITAAGIPATTYSGSDPILLKRVAQNQGAVEVPCPQQPTIRADEVDWDFWNCRRESDERPVPYG